MNSFGLTRALGFLLLPWLLGCSDARDPPVSDRAAHDLAAAPTDALDSIIAHAEYVYFGGEYDSARAVWLSALDRARAKRDSVAETRILTWLGLAAWRLGDYAEARERGEEALGLKLRYGLDSLLPKSYNAAGLLAWNEGRFTEAARLFEHTAAAAQAIGDAEYVYKASANLALVHIDLANFGEARQRLMAARSAAQELGDTRTEGNTLTNLAALANRTGDWRSAIGWIEEARHLYRSTGYMTGEAVALGQLATAYIGLGDLRLALAALDTALGLSQAQGLRQEEAANFEWLAEVYREVGDLQRALQLYDKAKVINLELGLVDETGADLRSKAQIHATLGNLNLAQRYATEALEIHSSIGSRREEVTDLVLLAELAQSQGHDAEVASHLLAAQSLTRDLDVRGVRVDLALGEARIADRRGKAKDVLRVLDAVEEDLLLSGYGTEWEVELLRARAYARLGDLERAALVGRRAVATVERVRSSFGSALLRSAYGTDKATAYADLVGVLIDLGRTAEAFEVADAARGRALLEHLAAVRNESMASQASASALAGGDEILRRIDGLVTSILEYEEYGDSAAVRELAQKLQQARREYELFAIHTAERNAPTTALLGGQATDVAAVQSALLPGEALVEYLVTPSRLFAFVMTPTELRSYETAISAEKVVGRVRLARDLLADPETLPEQARAVLGALHRVLISHVANAGPPAGVPRLIVVPHGVLTYLPFGALRDEHTGRYLVEDYALLYLPSAAALPVLRAEQADREWDRAAMRTGTVFAPLPRTLPASRAEAETVRRALRQAELFIGSRATETRVREALSNGGIVHVASHSVMNARSPLFSRIEMAGATGRAANDGRLEVHEVLGVPIRSPLVFLSGCETGFGAAWSTAFARGEDYATLAQAFLYAGARNVVATLWPVEDAGAAEFAEGFYGLLSELGPAEALARAQREMISDPHYGHPYYWAAYRLAGVGELFGRAQKASALSVSQ